MTDDLRFSHGQTNGSQEPFHYRACGVEGVYLENGFERTPDEGYGKGFVVHDADELHRLIGISLALYRPHLGYREVRFMRTQMALTQRELGLQIGVGEQMIARYEKSDHTDISGPADRLMRLVYATHLFPKYQSDVMNAVLSLHEIADSDATNMVFKRAQDHWKEQPYPLLNQA